MTMTDTLPMLYFGKLPCRGDFVRSASHPALIQSLDRWLSSGVELMAEDAHWKQIYDQADSAHFAMLSPHRNTAVVGHIVPSVDTSGRRFPFLTACTIESENGTELLGLGPLKMQATWGRLAEAGHKARAANGDDAAIVLGDLAQLTVPGLMPSSAARLAYRRYLEQTTVSSFVQDLSDINMALDVRQTVLALGLLLQPVMNSVGQPIEKGLSLPLPREDFNRFLVGTFWMDLLSRFLARSHHDLTLFMPRGVNHKPCLMIGFSAGAANVLQGLLDPRVTSGVFLSLNESPWVEAYVANDYALKKLSSYLQQPQMSLAQVLDTFQEAFLGS
ncbi:MAG: type VI secretion system-associated protein TagF [Comamonadaceae bacterium]|nr:type VI secretion system-associated protein TagF [Comamonadaceae bacterium]